MDAWIKRGEVGMGGRVIGGEKPTLVVKALKKIKNVKSAGLDGTTV